MFNTISRRYDTINRILSLGQDKSWRKKMAKQLPRKDMIHLLDLATGTADQIISLFENSPQIEKAVGIDMAEKMIALAKKKMAPKPFSGKVKFLCANAEELPFEDDMFDVVTISFGIRNFENKEKALKEIHRVLKKEGRLLILEFSLPPHQVMKKFHLFYLRHILPIIGGMLSKSKKSYEYLNQTIETFPYGKDFLNLLKEHNFRKPSSKPLFFGAVSLYQADK